MVCLHSSPSPTPVDERTRREVGLRPTLCSLPCFVPLQKQGFDLFPVLADVQFCIPHPTFDSDGGVQISMCAIPTDQTTKRLLIGSIRLLYRVAHTALLGGIGALHSGCS